MLDAIGSLSTGYRAGCGYTSRDGRMAMPFLVPLNELQNHFALFDASRARRIHAELIIQVRETVGCYGKVTADRADQHGRR